MSRGRLWPNVAREWCPWSVIRRICHAADIGQMWQKNDAPHWRTLSQCRLQPNVVQIVPLIRGLCHAVDFNQMWPKMCLSLEDFVTQRTLTKCGPKCAPCWRTLSHSKLQPNMVQTCALQWMTSFCYRVRPHMDRQRTHHQKWPVPSKGILIVDQRRTKTAVSDYNAMWSIC